MQGRQFATAVCWMAWIVASGASMPCLLAEEPTSADLAAWVKQQISDGRMSVKFSDTTNTPRRYPGWTDFEFRLEYQYEYHVDVSPKKAFKVPVIVQPKFTKVKVPITHRILLPKRLEAEIWYDAPLGRHELDHVRVGTQPRLKMLSKHLLEKLTRIEATVDRPLEVTADWVKRHIDDAVAHRRDAIQALVGAINRKIDSDTQHGALPLPDRDEFFAGLFLKENLDEMKFPYLPEVLDLIGTREYQEARLQIGPAAVGDKPAPR